ncbi:MAG: OmpA family protein, partial [Sinobacteraceae bacterium]|nr:OmpA family protein [Nevskiaceae bacterium]
GTRAYNQVLGESRAEAVEAALEAEGVPASQLSTTSFGKERPVCTEHAESCWQLNRRADLVRR